MMTEDKPEEPKKEVRIVVTKLDSWMPEKEDGPSRFSSEDLGTIKDVIDESKNHEFSGCTGACVFYSIATLLLWSLCMYSEAKQKNRAEYIASELMKQGKFDARIEQQSTHDTSWYELIITPKEQ